MKKSEIFFGALKLPMDFIAIMAAFLLAYTIRPFTDLIPGVQYVFQPTLLPPFMEYLRFALVATTGLLVLFIFSGLYSMKLTEPLRRMLIKIVFLVSAWVMFIIAYYFLIVHALFFSRITLAHIWLFSLFFVLSGRFFVYFIQSFLLRFGIGQRRLLFIGADALADDVYSYLKNDRRYKVIGALSNKRESRRAGTLQVVGTLEDLELFVKKYDIEEIIQAEGRAGDSASMDILGFCRANQIQYHFIPDLLRLQRTNVETEMVGDIPLISLKQTPLDGWGRVYKRAFDTTISFLLILIFTPLWLVVSLLITFDSPGPVIYKSRRKYRNHVFNMYKFRTMRADADRLKASLTEQNERSGPLFKIKNDPRVTRLGKFLRKTSIDELPQLFNVLFGDMSLVGPRPHLPEEVEQYQKHHRQVFAIKPGVTGLAQISGRSDLDFEDEVKLDIYYIENWSPWMDVKLILKSAFVPFRGDGC
ncbi:sugar transferase [Candidatus Peregrinibacteria bacterium]|nr:sugar transferase [Candidatus Peregrinibacteria bacterium]